MKESDSFTGVWREVRRALRRQKGKGILCFLAVIVVTVVVTAFSAKSYRSEAKLYVQLGRENATLDPTATLGQEPMVVVPQTRETEINSAVEVLMSRNVAERVVDALGPEVILGTDSDSGSAGPAGQSPDHPAALWLAEAAAYCGRAKDWCIERARWCLRREPLDDRERAILAIQEGLYAEAVRKSTVVYLSYEAESPELAQAVVDKTVEFYLDEHLGMSRPHGSHEFLSRETDHLREQLFSTQAELSDLKIATALVSPTARQEILAKRMGRLEDELLQTNHEIATTGTEVNRLREMLAALPKTEVINQTSGINDHGTDLIRGQVNLLELQEQGAIAKYTPEHPKMKEIAEQAAAARRVLESEPRTSSQVTTGPGRLVDELRVQLANREPQLAALNVKAEMLKTQVAAVRDDLKRFISDERQVADLQRELDLQEASYRTYSQNLQQARIDDALESQRISNVHVVQPATLERKPTRPRVSVSLALGLAAALFGSLTLMLVAEQLDHSVKTEEELEEKLDIPLLASIPRLKPTQLVVRNGNGKH
jgi:uncharacterized protein involved in exopolysaccharide biosynthesis